MTTKQRILNEALNLFSEKGYSAVYVGDIADAVGIKAPSLYKHYKSKQAIFDSCVEVFSERMEQVRNKLRLPCTSNADINYQTASMETIIEIAINLFVFYLQDDVAAKFRKMLMNSKIVFVMFLAVDKALRSKGYGSAILQDIQSKYPKKDYHFH